MIKIAVTGGIGSGKTLICNVFEKLGIPVFYADLWAKEIMNSDNVIKEKLISYFGTQIFDVNNQLIKRRLAEIIFNNTDSLLKVNDIVHPAVKKGFENWMQNQNSSYVIEETAIVFESGLAQFFDKIISVTAPLEMRIERVMKRDNATRKKVMERIKNQNINENYHKKSDFLIINNEIEMILPQIINIHNKLL